MTQKVDTMEGALAECDRLAKANPGKDFYVMSEVSHQRYRLVPDKPARDL